MWKTRVYINKADGCVENHGIYIYTHIRLVEVWKTTVYIKKADGCVKNHGIY